MPLNQQRSTKIEGENFSAIFIEREPIHDVRLQSIKKELYANFSIKAAAGMRRFSRFEIHGLSIEEVWRVNYQVFSTLGLDYLIDPTELFDQEYILPLTPIHQKYDLKAASSLRLLKFYYPYRDLFVRSSEILVFSQPVSDAEKMIIQELLVDQTNLSISKLRLTNDLMIEFDQPDEVAEIADFVELSTEELTKLKEKYDLIIAPVELEDIQAEFKKENRNPLESELLLLDRIRSSQNKINKIDLGKVSLAENIDPGIAASHAQFIEDMGNMNFSEYLEQIANCGSVDNSDWKFDLQIDIISDQTKTYKVNTFAGLIKSSMIQGTKPIQAMRLSIHSPLKKPVKTPRSSKQQADNLYYSKKIKTLREQTKQVSLYAKKSNLPISYVKEYYSDTFGQGYEISGLLSYKSVIPVQNQELIPNDIAIILGARTDLEENNRGSDAEQNKILQRFLIDYRTQAMLKQTSVLDHDGLVVAAAKLERGIMLNLDVMPLAQGGLTGMDIAFSKTDDRVLVIVGVEYRHKFISLAQANGLEATVIGKIISTDKIKVHFRGQTIIDLDKSLFSFTNQSMTVNPIIELGKFENKESKKSFPQFLTEKIESMNVVVQRGLINNFSSFIGGNNILAQLGGKFEKSPEQGMIAQIDLNRDIINKVVQLKSERSKLFLLTTHSYYPEIISQSPYHGAYQAVLSSYLKNIAMGGNPKTARIHLFIGIHKPQQNRAWGNYYSAILGAYQAKKDFDLPIIKLQTEYISFDENEVDSVTESITNAGEDLPIVIGFTLNTKNKNRFATATLSEPDLQAYLVDAINNPYEKISKTKMKSVLSLLHRMLNQGQIRHALISEHDSVSDITKACLGEGLGFEFESKLLNRDLLQNNFGRLIIFVNQDNADILREKPSLTYLGRTTEKRVIKRRNTELDLAKLNHLYETGLSKIYPVENRYANMFSEATNNQINPENNNSQFVTGLEQSVQKKLRKKVNKPKVLLPVFESSIGIDRLQQVLSDAGAEVECLIFSSGREEWTKQSIRIFADKINSADALVLPGGYDLGDQPDGVAKFLGLILEQDAVKKSINELLAGDGRILGIGNGFQALIACGLLPYGRYREWGDKQGYFASHQEYFGNNRLLELEVISNTGNWFEKENIIFESPIIADYWNLNMPPSLWDYCIEHNLILTKFKTDNQDYIEAMTSPDGKILGRISHPEFIASEIINRPRKQDSEFFRRFVKMLTKPII
ncbi:MAG TPA: hypothetical protein GXZ43_05225 [Clostridiaceae bacterium]|nr:hypothetical protein [Clostridiaceae bacterium]